MRALVGIAFSFLVLSQAQALNMAFSNADLRAQEKQHISSVSGADALSIAIQIMLNDSETSKSPLSITGSQEALLHALTAPDTQLYLVTAKDEDHKPQWGEDVAQNWIFCLYLPSVSDHLYWAVIDRNKAHVPYAYGFN